MDVSTQRLAQLRRQLDSRLKSVLRDEDFQKFDLDGAIQRVVNMARILSPSA